MIRKSFKFRIYPSKAQETKLELTLAVCRELYNAALQERRDAWRINRINISNQHQEKQLPEIKRIREDLNLVYSQVLQDVLKRVDRSFQNFFCRLKTKGKAGFPRFQGKSRYNSFTYKQSGFSFADGKLNLSKIGKIKIKLHREIVGKLKTLTIVRDSCGKWFACFSVETKPEILAPTGISVGVDVGIATFITLSDGVTIENPRFFERSEKILVKAQRCLGSQTKGTKQYRKKRKVVAKIHARIRNRRTDFTHQVSSFLIKHYDNIFFEDLNIQEMVQNHYFAKTISDAAWKQTMEFTRYKAEDAGRNVRMVDPKNTSQICSRCGEWVKKKLSCRIHHCLNCGLKIDRDLNASLNIKTLGLKSLGFALEASRL